MCRLDSCPTSQLQHCANWGRLSLRRGPFSPHLSSASSLAPPPAGPPRAARLTHSIYLAVPRACVCVCAGAPALVLLNRSSASAVFAVAGPARPATLERAAFSHGRSLPPLPRSAWPRWPPLTQTHTQNGVRHALRVCVASARRGHRAAAAARSCRHFHPRPAISLSLRAASPLGAVCSARTRLSASGRFCESAAAWAIVAHGKAKGEQTPTVAGQGARREWVKACSIESKCVTGNNKLAG